MQASKKKPSAEARLVTVSTDELQQVLGCGRATAVKVGTDAGARVRIGRRTLWLLSRVERFIEQQADAQTE